jgi:TfoX/Sxy family transcriptional regulator of competence genes
MAYDEGVAQRLREIFEDRKDITEKRMFGGIAFLLSGNMCCGVVGDTLMARVGPDRYEEALSRPHAREMDFTGRPMRGLVYVSPDGFESDSDLRSWVALSESFAVSLPAKK